VHDEAAEDDELDDEDEATDRVGTEGQDDPYMHPHPSYEQPTPFLPDLGMHGMASAGDTPKGVDPVPPSTTADDHDSMRLELPIDGHVDPTRAKRGEVAAASRQVLTCMKCDRSAGLVYIGGHSGELIAFDVKSQREVWRRKVMVERDGETRTADITALDWRDNQLALGCLNGQTLIYDLESFSVTQTWSDHTARVSSIAWASDSVVYTTGYDGFFLARSVEKQGQILHSFVTCTCPLTCMVVEPHNTGAVFIASLDGQMKRLDLDRKQVTLVLKATPDRESPVRAMALAPAPVIKKKASKKKEKSLIEEMPSYLLVLSHGVGEIRSWDLRGNKVHVASYLGCSDVVNSLLVSNGRIYAACDDRTVRIFELDTGTYIDSLGGHENGVNAVALVGVDQPPTPIVEAEDSTRTDAKTGRDNNSAADPLASAGPSRAVTHRSTKSTDAKQASEQEGTEGVNVPAAPEPIPELLMTVSFDCTSRMYSLDAVNAAIEQKKLALEEMKQQAFEAFVASKTKPKAKSKKKGGDGAASGKKKKKKTGSSESKPSSAGSKPPSASAKKKKASKK